MCIETEDILVPFIDSKNGEEVELSTIMNSITHSDDYSQEMEYCRLCRKCSKIASMVPFNTFLGDPTILRVFEKHIPEMVCNVYVQKIYFLQIPNSYLIPNFGTMGVIFLCSFHL